MPVLNYDNIDKLLVAVNSKPEKIKKIYNNLTVKQICDFIELKKDDELTTNIFEYLEVKKLADVFEVLEMQNYLERLNIEKVMKLYFHYREAGNIKKMA